MDSLNTIPTYLCREWSYIQHYSELSCTEVRSKPVGQHRKCCPRFMAKSGHPAGTRIQQLHRGIHKWIQSSIVITYTCSERPITVCCPLKLNPLVLIWRNSLLRELPANPFCLLRKNYTLIHSQRSQRSCTSPRTASNNRYICLPFTVRMEYSHKSRSGKLQK